MRLVGGTGLALQYGHRISVDLDIFGSIPEEVDEMRKILRHIGELRIIKETAHIRLCLIDGIKVDFVDYQYPWIDDAMEEDGIRIASDKDIAAMKINGIQGRGTKKDFIDLYFILKRHSLSEIINYYKRKYKEYSVFRALMSLTYFNDAEEQVPPKMLVPATWEDIKTDIDREVKAYSLTHKGM